MTAPESGPEAVTATQLPLPEIAVVVTCHNLGGTLEAAVASALSQTRPAAEIVVMDDGSTETETLDALSHLVRGGVRVERLPRGGVAAARNRGVALTTAPYIVFLDADDRLDPEHHRVLGERLDADPNLAFVTCAVQAFEGANYVWTPPAVTAMEMLTNGSPHVSSLLRREAFECVGGFDSALPAYEDLEFWLRIVREGFRGAIVSEPLLFYRVRENSRYARGVREEVYREAFERIIDRHRDFVSACGVSILIAKEEFVVSQIAYGEELRARLTAAGAETEALDGEILRLEEQLQAQRNEDEEGGTDFWAAARRHESFLQECEARGARTGMADEDELVRAHERFRDLAHRVAHALGEESGGARERTVNLTRDLGAARAEQARLEADLGALRESEFWRMTGPARRVLDRAKALLRR